MKIMNFDFEMTLSTNNVELEEDYGVIKDDGTRQYIGEQFKREVGGLYIVEDCECRPILMVDWKWWLDEDDQFILLPINCTTEELSILYSLGIL